MQEQIRPKTKRAVSKSNNTFTNNSSSSVGLARHDGGNGTVRFAHDNGGEVRENVCGEEVREERPVDGGTDGGTNATERKMDDHWRRNEQLEVEEERTRVLLI
jgi:hypothetical protein